MNKRASRAAPLALVLILCGCGLGSPSLSSGGSATSGGTRPVEPTASGPTTTGVPSQSTPEGAVTVWLQALVRGDTKTVCSVMATDGKPYASIPGAAEACGKAIMPMRGQLGELQGQLEGLTVTGATVTGARATFQSASTRPALASDVVGALKAQRIGGRWYLTQE